MADQQRHTNAADIIIDLLKANRKQTAAELMRPFSLAERTILQELEANHKPTASELMMSFPDFLRKQGMTPEQAAELIRLIR